jgi:pyruvate/2-oxoglutarate dehydrogenase complex dihydrolipoamide dehydrogenase (E3) component
LALAVVRVGDEVVTASRGVVVAEQCRAAPGLWAVGDVTGVGAFTHLAVHQAGIAVADILGTRVRPPTTPRCRGPAGGEVLGLMALAVHARVPVATLDSMILAYPTFTRGLRDALIDLRA